MMRLISKSSSEIFLFIDEDVDDCGYILFLKDTILWIKLVFCLCDNLNDF